MNCKEAQETPRVAVRIIEPDQAQLLILVVLVFRPFFGGVRQIRTGTTVPVPIHDSRIANAELAGLQRRVCALDSEDRPLDNGFCGFLDISERCHFGKEVLKVTTNTAMLVRGGQGDVVVIVVLGVK